MRLHEFGERIGRVLERIGREREQRFCLAGYIDPRSHLRAAFLSPRFRS